jgi:hypothetical protein
MGLTHNISGQEATQHKNKATDYVQIFLKLYYLVAGVGLCIKGAADTKK